MWQRNEVEGWRYTFYTKVKRGLLTYGSIENYGLQYELWVDMLGNANVEKFMKILNYIN